MDDNTASSGDRASDASAADRRADLIGVAVIFVALVAMAVHFISGWTFDWTYDLF